MSKVMLSKRTTVGAGIVLCMIVAGACSVNGNLLVGPVRVTATIGEASFVEFLPRAFRPASFAPSLPSHAAACSANA